MIRSLSLPLAARGRGRRTSEDRMRRLVLGVSIAVALALGAAWLSISYPYVLHALVHGRGYHWIETTRDDPVLSPSMQRALRGAPGASPGAIEWRRIRDGL